MRWETRSGALSNREDVGCAPTCPYPRSHSASELRNWTGRIRMCLRSMRPVGLSPGGGVHAMTHESAALHRVRCVGPVEDSHFRAVRRAGGAIAPCLVPAARCTSIAACRRVRRRAAIVRSAPSGVRRPSMGFFVPHARRERAPPWRRRSAEPCFRTHHEHTSRPQRGLHP